MDFAILQGFCQLFQVHKKQRVMKNKGVR